MRLLRTAPTLLALASTIAAADPSYLIASSTGVRVVPFATAGNQYGVKPDGSPYIFVGLPDGMGLYQDATRGWQLLVNHEPSSDRGVVRAHGNKGAFVSRWTLATGTAAGGALVKAVKAEDFNQSATSIQLYTAAGTWTAGTTAYSRLCSADLPAPTAFFNPASGLGTQDRIFLNGEEDSNSASVSVVFAGSTGRAFGHVATGADAGKSFELPHLGKQAWENLLANPHPQDLTLVAGMDDSGPDTFFIGSATHAGQVLFYTGMKRSSGNAVERAGLVGGTAWGVQVPGYTAENRDTAFFGSVIVEAAKAVGLAKEIRFNLVDLGDVSGKSFNGLESDAFTKGVTVFNRPEDGQWDPTNPNDFYFVTTDRFDDFKNGGSAASNKRVGRSRLWRLRFDDLENPQVGGVLTMLIDGSENPGPQMMDNLTIDRMGRVILQEDPGNQDHSARIWVYEIGSKRLYEVAKFDPALFGDRVAGVTKSATAPFTKDDESSGVIDASEMLGPGWFLVAAQAHGTSSPLNTPEMIEGGQLAAVYIPLADSHAKLNKNGMIEVSIANLLKDPSGAGTVLPTFASRNGATVTVIGNKLHYHAKPGFTGIDYVDFNYRVFDPPMVSRRITGATMPVVAGAVLASGAVVTPGARAASTSVTPSNMQTILTIGAGMASGSVKVNNTGFGSAIAPVAGTNDQFWLMTDRGPNVDGPTINNIASKIFPNPTFNPNLIKVKVDRKTGEVTKMGMVGMKDATGMAITGLPNPGNGGTGEVAVDVFGNQLVNDPNGIDSEGLAVMADGSFWTSDEYGPWLTKFNSSGTMLERVGPFETNAMGHKIPSVFRNRFANRGMEGLTVTPNGTVVGMMQSGLSVGTANGRRLAALRILAWNPSTNTSKQYLYVLEDSRSGSGNFNGAVSAITAIDNNRFLVLERDGEWPAEKPLLKKIFTIDLSAATDVSDSTDSVMGMMVGTSATKTSIEEMIAATSAAVAKTKLAAVGIVPVSKMLSVDLTAAGLASLYNHDKPEGITLIDNGRTLVVANDDDFGINGDNGTQKLSKLPGGRTGVVDSNQLLFIDLMGRMVTGNMVFQVIDPTIVRTATGAQLDDKLNEALVLVGSASQTALQKYVNGVTASGSKLTNANLLDRYLANFNAGIPVFTFEVFFNHIDGLTAALAAGRIKTPSFLDLYAAALEGGSATKIKLFEKYADKFAEGKSEDDLKPKLTLPATAGALASAPGKKTVSFKISLSSLVITSISDLSIKISGASGKIKKITINFNGATIAGVLKDAADVNGKAVVARADEADVAVEFEDAFTGTTDLAVESTDGITTTSQAVTVVATPATVAPTSSNDDDDGFFGCGVGGTLAALLPGLLLALGIRRRR